MYLSLALSLLCLTAPVSLEDHPPLLLSACDVADEWDGGTLDAELKQQGSGSIRWAHGDSSTLRLKQFPQDWSDYTAVRFQLHSEIATKSSFMLILRSENPDTEGMDYYMAKITLDYTGWKPFTILFRGIGAARRPRGWSEIDEVFFTSTGWENTPDPRAVVHLDGLELCDMTGPLMTDQELFGQLDLDLPELAQAKAAAEAQDWDTARDRLGAYYRVRTGDYWWYDAHRIDRKARHNQEAADQTVHGEIQQVALWYTFPEGRIDWFCNPTLLRDDWPDNHEWQWQLCRMGFWGELGRTYWATGDETYAKTFVDQLRTFVKQCPRPSDSGNYSNSAWRTIEAGIRMGGPWPDAYCRFLESPSFTNDDIVLFLKSCLEQAAHLRAHPTGGNWLTMEMSGLYSVGVLFPEAKPAAEWRQYAAQRLFQELTGQFQPDGAQVELSTGYHQVALENICQLPRLAAKVGRLDELPADYTAGVEQAYAYNLKLMAPNRDLPWFNDSWPVNVRGSLARALVFFPQRQDFRWLVSDGKEGAAPDFTSVDLPYAGYYAMRSGWETDANYLCLDAGPLGAGHYHHDKLNVVVWTHGRQMLYDGGGGSYERSKWRAYGTDTFSHNTVLVDGKPQRRDTNQRSNRIVSEPNDVRWETNDRYDYAIGTYDAGYGKPDHQPATHERRVLFCKPDLFVVADVLTPSDEAEHTYQARWHLMTSEHRDNVGTRGVSSVADGPNLAVVPLLGEGLDVRTVVGQTEPEVLGWWVRKDLQPREAPTATVCHTRQGTGRQVILTLLLPLAAGRTSGIDHVTQDGLHSTVAMSDGRTWTFTVDPAPRGELTAIEKLANGQAGREIRTGG